MDIIAGGGKYGCDAVELLRQKGKGFVVVDINPRCLAVKRFGLKASSHKGSEDEHFIQGDLSKVLELLERVKPEFLFPTAPVHIAADLAKIKFDLELWVEGINSVLPRLPQTVVLLAGEGKIIVSFKRDHKCIAKRTMPEACPSPVV